MSTCEQIQKILTVHEQDRTEQEREILQAHLATCPLCAHEEKVYNGLDSLLAATMKKEVSAAGIPPLIPPQSSLTQPNINARQATTWLAIAASVIFVIGAAGSAYMIGNTRAELRHLRTQLLQSQNRCAKLESLVASKDKELTALAKHIANGPVRRVSYNIFTSNKEADQSLKTAASLWGYHIRQLKGERHDFDQF